MRHTFLANTEDTDGSVSLCEVLVPPGTGAPLHSKTREAETYVVLEGSLTFVREGVPTTVSEGEAIFMDRHERQSWANTGDEAARVLLIWTPGGQERFLLDAAEVMPEEAPEGPPPPEAVAALAEIGARYGVELYDS